MPDFSAATDPGDLPRRQLAVADAGLKSPMIVQQRSAVPDQNISQDAFDIPAHRHAPSHMQYQV